MSKVFLLDTNKRPLNLIHPSQARWLLTHKKAAVFKRYPFTVILFRAIDDPDLKPLRLKIDPGSKTTGLALVDDSTGSVEWAGELSHRGTQIRDALTCRRQLRRSRRNRKTRYRKPRFNNRTRLEGSLPPSLMSRVHNISTWVSRIRRLAPVTAISQELVKFDLQQIENPEISGVEYQQGELAGYEVREYLLEKWHRQCAYCGQGDVTLQLEHIVPRAKGGSDRVSNLCLACEPCNLKKGVKDIKVFLAKKPDVLNRILAGAKKPL